MNPDTLQRALSPLIESIVALEGKVRSLSQQKGPPGIGIKSIMQVGDHHLVLMLEDQQQLAFKLPAAKDGVGITDIRPVNGRLCVKMSNGVEHTFEIPRGEKGESIKGDKGESIKGDKGDKGDSIKGDKGRGIKSVETEGSDVVRFVFDDGEEVPVRLPRGPRGAEGNGITAVESDGKGMMTLVFSNGSKEEFALPRGLKGDKGDSIKGDKGDSVKGDPGVGIAEMAGDGHQLTVKLDNGQVATFELPRGIQGKAADPEDVALILAARHAETLRGPRGVQGDTGAGIEAKAWEPGVHRAGSVVQAFIGQYFKAVSDTAEEPGDSQDWVRIGNGGFRWRKVKKEGVVYSDGDLFIDDGTTFLYADGRAHMLAKRGDRGYRGEKGDKGDKGDKGAIPVGVRLTQDSLVFAFNNGELLEASTKGLIEYLGQTANEAVSLLAESPEFKEKVMSWVDQGFADSESGKRTPITAYRGTHQPGMKVQRGDVVVFNNKMWLAKQANSADLINADDYEPLPGGGTRAVMTSGGGEPGPGGPVTSVNGMTGDVELDKSHVGLSQVDNTSDANKPVSLATSAALATKSNTGHTHTMAEVTDLAAAMAAKSNTGHTHTMAEVTDLAAAMALKAPLASPTFTGTPAVPTAAPGTNTTQAASTAFVVAADALKANLASPAFTGTPTVPTASPGTNTTQAASTAFVAAAVAAGGGGGAGGIIIGSGPNDIIAMTIVPTGAAAGKPATYNDGAPHTIGYNATTGAPETDTIITGVVRTIVPVPGSPYFRVSGSNRYVGGAYRLSLAERALLQADLAAETLALDPGWLIYVHDIGYEVDLTGEVNIPGARQMWDGRKFRYLSPLSYRDARSSGVVNGTIANYGFRRFNVQAKVVGDLDSVFVRAVYQYTGNVSASTKTIRIVINPDGTPVIVGTLSEAAQAATYSRHLGKWFRRKGTISEIHSTTTNAELSGAQASVAVGSLAWDFDTATVFEAQGSVPGAGDSMELKDFTVGIYTDMSV